MPDVPTIYKYFAEEVLTRWKTSEEFLAAHQKLPAETLALLVVNTHLNDFVRGHSDGLYFGWWWRNVDWFTPGGITIARSGRKVAVCQNNKWGYPQRPLTSDEQARFRNLVWKAHLASMRGGSLKDIEDAVERRISKARAFLQSLEVAGDQ